MSQFHSLSHHLRSRIEAELNPHEEIEWAGKPAARLFTSASVGLMIFASVFLAFAAFWVVVSLLVVPQVDDVGVFRYFPLFGLPFALIGLGLLTAPYWLRRRAQNTVYAITNQRLMILSGKRNVAIRSILPEAIETTTRREHSKGTGDVIFSKEHYRDSDGDHQVSEIGFFAIPNAKSVEEHILRLAQSSPTTTPS